METRKIQITGKSTFVISLPKKWVTKVDLKSGDSVGIFPLPDNTLLINPNVYERDRVPTRTVIVVNDDIDELMRRFVGAYLSGYSIIEFRSPAEIPIGIKQHIRRFSQHVIGPQIIEETSTSMSFKDMLDASDFSLGKAVKRMQLITMDMLKDATGPLNGNDDRTGEIKARDDEVDKLNWMVSKQYYRILRDALFADKMGMTSQEAMSHLLIARCLERMADHAVRIATNARLLDVPISDLRGIDDSVQRIRTLLDDVLNAFFKGRVEQSFELAYKAKDTMVMLEGINQDLLSNGASGTSLVPLAYILDSLERITSYAEDVAEISINHQFVKEYDAALMRGK